MALNTEKRINEIIDTLNGIYLDSDYEKGYYDEIEIINLQDELFYLKNECNC